MSTTTGLLESNAGGVSAAAGGGSSGSGLPAGIAGDRERGGVGGRTSAAGGSRGSNVKANATSPVAAASRATSQTSQPGGRRRGETDGQPPDGSPDGPLDGRSVRASGARTRASGGSETPLGLFTAPLLRVAVSLSPASTWTPVRRRPGTTAAAVVRGSEAGGRSRRAASAMLSAPDDECERTMLGTRSPSCTPRRGPGVSGAQGHRDSVPGPPARGRRPRGRIRR